MRRSLLPRLALDPGRLQAPRAVFDVPVSEVWLEVGFGSGEHLLELARANPKAGLIGAEAYETGIDKLLSKLEEADVPRIRLYQGDGRDIVAALPDASLGRFFLLFPDPWPKTRHRKRRFVQMEILDALARVMRPGAELRFASDDASYVAWALERFMAHPAFRWTARGPQDWTVHPVGWPETRYEKKALRGPPNYFSFVRA